MTRSRIVAALALLAACTPDDTVPDGSTTRDEASSTDDPGTTATTAVPTPTTGDIDTTAAASDTGDETTGGEPSRIDEILAALTTSMYTCPERIWPDIAANYRARQVLLVSQLENHAWLWNNQEGSGDPPRVSDGPLDGLPAEWLAEFNIGELQGAVTLGISLDYTAELAATLEMSGDTVWPDYAVTLTFHEGFHFLSDQDDWNTPNGSRNAPYPEPWEARYLRRMLLDALLAETADPGTGLAAAAHWQARLLAEHADEMDEAVGYECTEGSAEYVSLMMSALAELGCDAPDADLLALAVSHLPDGIFVSADGYSPGREYYNLGVAAGLLLRRDAVDNWELNVEDGQTPISQVVAGVSPEPQPDDPAIQMAAQTAVAARNETVGMEIEPMLAHMQDPAYTRVVVDFNWISGSFSVGGFYYLAEDPDQSEVLLRFGALLEPPSAVAITAAELTSLQGITTPCALSGGSSLVFAVPTADLELTGMLASITSDRLTFTDLEVEPTMDMDNLPWLCPTDAGGAGGAPYLPDPVVTSPATPHPLGHDLWTLEPTPR